jgi:hypothetical protein
MVGLDRSDSFLFFLNFGDGSKYPMLALSIDAQTVSLLVPTLKLTKHAITMRYIATTWQ